MYTRPNGRKLYVILRWLSVAVALFALLNVLGIDGPWRISSASLRMVSRILSLGL
jgi:hypothetical protein